jgi:hypothetical protein
MATHTTSCPHCGEYRNFRTQSAGTLQKCKGCGREFRLPALVAPLLPPPPPVQPLPPPPDPLDLDIDPPIRSRRNAQSIAIPGMIAGGIVLVGFIGCLGLLILPIKSGPKEGTNRPQRVDPIAVHRFTEAEPDPVLQIPNVKPLSPEEVAKRQRDEAERKAAEEEKRLAKEARLKEEAEARAKAAEVARIKEAEEQAMKDELLAGNRLEAVKKITDFDLRMSKFREISIRYPKTEAGEEARKLLEKNGK